MEKKKRGRKPKKNKNKKVPNKKRGRKPKGGKIIKTNMLSEQNQQNVVEANIILHLKCSTKDLQIKQYKLSAFDYKPEISTIEGFNITDKSHDVGEYNQPNQSTKKNENIKKKEEKEEKKYNKKYNKEICQKLKELQKQLHFNNVSDKKSDCFWCTFSFYVSSSSFSSLSKKFF